MIRRAISRSEESVPILLTLLVDVWRRIILLMLLEVVDVPTVVVVVGLVADGTRKASGVDHKQDNVTTATSVVS